MKVLLPGAVTLARSPFKTAFRNFAAAFEETWKQLAEEPRQTILNYFRVRPAWVYLCYKMDHADLPIEPFGRCVWREDATPMTYHAPFFELNRTDTALRAVIGHELAHCYRRGAGVWTMEEAIEEQETRELALAWGFDAVGFGGDLGLLNRWLQGVEEWRVKHKKYRDHSEHKWIGSSG